MPDLGPGNRFLEIELPDHSGHQRRLLELAGGDPLMLSTRREAGRRRDRG